MIVILDPRPGPRARLTAILDSLNAKYTVMAAASQVLAALPKDEVEAVIVAPQLTNMSGSGLLALVRSLRPRLEQLTIDQPDQDRGLIENLVRRLKAQR